MFADRYLVFVRVNDGIRSTRVKGKFHNVTFSHVRAPAGVEEEYTDTFYDKLQSEFERIQTLR